MKILHIINNLGSGGAEKLIEVLVPKLNKSKGVDVEVLLLTDKNNIFDKKLNKTDIIVRVIKLKSPRNPFNILFIRRIIKKYNYDIVHAHLFPSNYWVAFAKLLMLKPPKLVVTEHSTFNKRRNYIFFRWIEKIVYFLYDSIICISNGTKENLLNWLRPKSINDNKYIVINNGIDLERFILAKPYKKTEIINQLDEENIILCMVGSFTIQKDQNTIIKSMEILAENTHLILVGDGPLKKECELLAKKLNLEKRVHFLGIRTDIERILKTVDIVIMSSNWEGFGLSALEGMAAGKPVIASNVEGLNDVVSGAGILFPQKNYQTLANKINKLIFNSNLYYKVSQECLKRSKYYSIDKMNEKYLLEYKNLIKS